VEQATIARSYASALFALAEKTGDHEAYGRAFASVNALLDSNRLVRDFVRSPKIAAAERKRILQTTLHSAVPPLFLNFLLVVFDKRRQRLLRAMAREYDLMMDERLGRLNVQVTLAREPEARELSDIASRLSRLTGKAVVPHVQVDGNILGGIIVRYGDHLLDGSLRRRLIALRAHMMDASLAAHGTRTSTS
jgi:F-type H+-transporting ATPase subunit delta